MARRRFSVHARDWDVFATETVPAAAQPGGGGRRPVRASDPLSVRVGRRRKAARAAARDAIRSPRFQQLLLAVGAAVRVAGFRRPVRRPMRDATVPVRAATFARQLLRRRHRRLVRRAASAIAGEPALRHALRIAAKKLRYAAEFFAPLLDGDRARDYVHALAALQDVLGRGNDAATAARLAHELAAGGDDRAAAALDQWLAATTDRPRTGTRAARGKGSPATKRFWPKS